MLIEDGATVLFQGDSITDCGRGRENLSLGCGYALMTAAMLGAQYPEKSLVFHNRGVSGNRVKDLRARWSEDCLDLEPTWLSILIGINDTWRRYDANDPTSLDAFEADYRAILQQAKNDSGCRLILLEPFLLPVAERFETWREDLDPKREAVRRLALEFSARLVPLAELFAAACESAAPAYWAADGVHPTPAGHALIARAWLAAVEAA